MFWLLQVQFIHFVTRGQLNFIKLIGHSQNGVHRAFEFACHIGQRIDYSLLVFAINTLGPDALSDIDQIAYRNHMSLF